MKGMNDMKTTEVWTRYTSKDKAVSVIRHDDNPWGGKWEVKSDLYESKYFPTKKSAIGWAWEIIETFNQTYEQKRNII